MSSGAPSQLSALNARPFAVDLDTAVAEKQCQPVLIIERIVDGLRQLRLRKELADHGRQARIERRHRRCGPAAAGGKALVPRIKDKCFPPPSLLWSVASQHKCESRAVATRHRGRLMALGWSKMEAIERDLSRWAIDYMRAHCRRSELGSCGADYDGGNQRESQ